MLHFMFQNCSVWLASMTSYLAPLIIVRHSTTQKRIREICGLCNRTNLVTWVVIINDHSVVFPI